MLVKISADSTCDLSPELIAAHQIEIVPLCVIKGGNAYQDGIEITPQDIYDYFDSGKGVCSTSAVSGADRAASLRLCRTAEEINT